MCQDCCSHMNASIKAVAVRICLCKESRFNMYAFLKVTVVKVCPYKAGMLP